MIEASILVVGGGAIGGVAAAKMTGAVRRVAVLDANEEHVGLMREPGLLLDELGEERRVQIEAHSDIAELDGEFDFALVTLKAPYLEAALEPLRDTGLVRNFVSLGNGLVQERIARIIGDENVIIGTVEWGGTNLGPGHLKQTTQAPFVVGEIDGTIRERTRLLARVLERVAEVRLTNNIRGQVWSKLLVNSTFSGLGAVSGLLYKEIAEDSVGREVAYSLWREGFDVGKAQNLEPEEVLGIPAKALIVRESGDRQRADEALQTLMEYVGDTKASMLQDLERGAKTEVDVINGGVVEHGQTHEVPTPLNARIVELVHEIERGEEQPSESRLESIK